MIFESGATISLPRCRPTFPAWAGNPPDFDFGKKPLIDLNGHPVFAELYILDLLQTVGWDGVWVETYGGTHYLRTMPKAWSLGSEHIAIPADKEALLKKIWTTAKTTACFDVLAWRGDQLLFCEVKRTGKDKLTDAQVRFIKGALACGIPPASLLIVEWSFAPENTRGAR